MRRAWLALAAVAGLVAGGAGTLAVQAGGEKAAPPVGPPPAGPDVLLVWTPGGLPPGVAASARDVAGVRAVTEVAGGTADLAAEAGDGWRIPVDVAAVDAATYEAFVPADVARLLAGLGAGRAVLGATSARLRGLGPGGRLVLAGGGELTVTGVVDDALVGAAEVVVAPGTVGGLVPRYLLVSHDGERAAVERAVRALLPAGTPVRFRARGETPFLREGDAVLPQALVKERFGEFAYRPLPGGGRDVEQDPAWQEEHLVTTAVPLLGRVRCHRALLPALDGALRELERRQLGHLVDPAGFAGCWAPRRIAPGAPLSRHAWGAALDLEHPDHPTGVAAAQDRRLVEVMARWGFTSGADWLVPDPAHFEYLRPPAA